MLTIPPETRSENGNPALRRRPANAETSLTSLNHTAPVRQCQREGWGEETARVARRRADWPNFVYRGVNAKARRLVIG